MRTFSEIGQANMDVATELASKYDSFTTTAAGLVVRNTTIIVEELSTVQLFDLSDNTSNIIALAVMSASEVAPAAQIDLERRLNETKSEYYQREHYVQPFRALHDALTNLDTRHSTPKNIAGFCGAVLMCARTTSAILQELDTGPNIPRLSYNKNYLDQNTTAATGCVKSIK